jgi:hypothetical protein
LVLSVWLRKP